MASGLPDTILDVRAAHRLPTNPSPSDFQHKGLRHIRSERPGTGHQQLAERSAERDIAHSLPSSLLGHCLAQVQALGSSILTRAKATASHTLSSICLARARWFPWKRRSTVVEAVGAAAGASLPELR